MCCTRSSTSNHVAATFACLQLITATTTTTAVVVAAAQRWELQMHKHGCWSHRKRRPLCAVINGKLVHDIVAVIQCRCTYLQLFEQSQPFWSSGTKEATWRAAWCTPTTTWFPASGANFPSATNGGLDFIFLRFFTREYLHRRIRSNKAHPRYPEYRERSRGGLHNFHRYSVEQHKNSKAKIFREASAPAAASRQRQSIMWSQFPFFHIFLNRLMQWR